VPQDKQKVTIKILRDISMVASKYMGGVVIVVFILCVLNSLGLYIIGFRYPIVMGIISALFNFIPYFGTLMGGAVPLLFALLVQDPVIAGRVVILFIIIQFTENNILTPNIVGGNVKISPFFIIVGLVMAAMIWGIPGMLVIIPVLAIMKIVFKNIDELQPYAFLLSTRGTQKHSINVKNLKKIGKMFTGFIKKGPSDLRK
jgi:predicted PurR-regulated permease PerM